MCVTGAIQTIASQSLAALKRPSLLLGLAVLALHLLANGGYGFFRDELYFIVCGSRPDWGYVDQPPLIPLIAFWSHAAFGDSLALFRLAPALAMAATAAMTAEFARSLGGGRLAQWLAGFCVMFSPVFLVLGVIYTTDMLQPLTWLALSWCFVRLVRTGDGRWWLAFGAVAGAGLWSKYLVASYAAALMLGMLATTLRRCLTRPWPYAGAAIAFLMILPNLYWQESHDWPFLDVASALAHGKNRVLTPFAFLAQQFFAMGPLTAPVWLAGLWAFSVRPAHAAFRAFPIAFVLLAAFLIAGHGKVNYFVAIYPALFAAGAVLLEAKFGAGAVRAALAAVAVEGAVFAPLALPILPEEAAIRYLAELNISPSLTTAEIHEEGRMQQHFGDMHGWPEMAAKVAAVYRALPPQERAKAVFLGRNYGDAAAIDVFGAKLGLPPAIGGHNNYYLWGPRGHDGSVVITVGGDRSWYLRRFRSVEVAGHTDNPYAQPSEIQPIYVLRGPKTPLPVMWRDFKRYG